MFAKNMAGDIIPLSIDSYGEEPDKDDLIKREIKKGFHISSPLFNINIFQSQLCEEKNIYSFIVNDIVTISIDESIKQVRHFIETYNRYIVDMNISKEEKISFILYEGDCRWNKGKYYVDNSDSLIKYCSTRLNDKPPYIMHIPDIRDRRGDKRNKFNKAIINGLKINKEIKGKVCFNKEERDDKLLFIDDIVKDIKETLERLKTTIPSTFDIMFESEK